MDVAKSAVKALLVLGFSSSILSALICRDITNYLIVLLLLGSFYYLLKEKSKIVIPVSFFWIISASLLYLGLATIYQISIAFSISLLLYSTLIVVLSIISSKIDLEDIVNKVFFIVLTLLLSEYLIILLSGGVIFVNYLGCEEPGVSSYRVLHNITSQYLGITSDQGLNSIFLGAQSASLFLVISIFWFFRRMKESSNIIDLVFFITSLILFVLSPTITGIILLLIGCFIYIILFNSEKIVSYRIAIILPSILMIAPLFIYFYIDIQHNFSEFIELIITPNFNTLLYVDFDKLLLGYGIEYHSLITTNEIAFISLLLMYGVFGFTIFIFLFLFIPLTLTLDLKVSDRAYLLIVLLLFTSLIHYNSSIIGGFLILYIAILSILFGKFINRVDK